MTYVCVCIPDPIPTSAPSGGHFQGRSPVDAAQGAPQGLLGTETPPAARPSLSPRAVALLLCLTFPSSLSFFPSFTVFLPPSLLPLCLHPFPSPSSASDLPSILEIFAAFSSPTYRHASKTENPLGLGSPDFRIEEK